MPEIGSGAGAARRRSPCLLAMTSHTLHIGGSDFHVEQRGRSPRAVFVHGFASDLHSWDLLWEQLGPQLAALRFDLRGFGRSSSPNGKAFTHADDLLSILDRTGIDQCDLVGVSMGGAIALNFTLNHPGRVRSLVLLSPGIVGWEWTQAWRTRWQAITAEARRGALDQARQLWWQHPLFATTRESAAGVELQASIERYSGAHWIRDDHQLLVPDIERLHQLVTPTLLLTGGRDVEDFRVIAALIGAGSTRVERIDDPQRGHLLHLEDPLTCARHINEFWSRTASVENRRL
jgi:pimeloyl-ACP methyl ester carboxylesterase